MMSIISYGKICGLILRCLFLCNNSRLNFADAILYEPFCCDESPTCHKDVPYGTPIHTHHSVSGLLMYSKKFKSKRLPWASTRSIGFSAFSRSVLKTFRTSNVLTISNKMLVHAWTRALWLLVKPLNVSALAELIQVS